MVVNNQIHTKTEIIQGLNEAFARMIQYCKDQDDAIFGQSLAPGKWSTAQNLEHLCTSTFPIAKAMSMPKLAMRATFGTNNREEKTIDGLFLKYKKALAGGQKAPAKFEPAEFTADQKTALLEKFSYARDKLIKALDKWDEAALSKYILPHPAIGKLTVREMLFFTIFHTDHHLNTIQSFEP